ncbi:hemerythrin domain-containing protein [Solemya velesiana gill symbiont]|uniref:Hemerythrin-like domain-containing protein n=1 Tax=Solemya velesiana gill symbiont TaxID=1918948 RepID=A0A1T2KVQ3_9GAMM|nr:hemerythrin domain-containing protein [Solemya velesiana gill symbiont]OOZ36881.1 hypothetical protein BOW51_04920 [Solemya velesiana gill symbiont]
MTAITETLSGDHRRCDEIFAQVEEWISKDDWTRGEPGFAEFHEAMEHHFAMEEGVLFPAFEARTGQAMGLSETLMMIMQQHNMKEEQMLYRMADQVLAADAEAVIQQMNEV